MPTPCIFVASLYVNQLRYVISKQVIDAITLRDVT